jgi:hypothetical protein
MVAVKQTELVIIDSSYSRARDHKRCPFKCACKNIKQLKDKYGVEPQNDAMYWGSAVHLMGQAFVEAKAPEPEGRESRDGEMWKQHGAAIRSAARTLPSVFAPFKAEMMNLRKQKAQCELQLAFTRDKWVRAGWFDKGIHRIKMDAMWYDKKTRTVHVPDYKTGKHNPDEHMEQLDTYAIAAFLMYPEALHCVAYLWYLDQGIEEIAEYDASELPALKKWYENFCKPMFNDRKFRPTPNSGCRWCFYNAANGGPCKQGAKS